MVRDNSPNICTSTHVCVYLALLIFISGQWNMTIYPASPGPRGLARPGAQGTWSPPSSWRPCPPLTWRSFITCQGPCHGNRRWVEVEAGILLCMYIYIYICTIYRGRERDVYIHIYIYTYIYIHRVFLSLSLQMVLRWYKYIIEPIWNFGKHGGKHLREIKQMEGWVRVNGETTRHLEVLIYTQIGENAWKLEGQWNKSSQFTACRCELPQKSVGAHWLVFALVNGSSWAF